MTISTKWIRVGNIACAILLLALLALQTFQPFWTMPACTCTKECTIHQIGTTANAKTIFDGDMNCPACSGYARLKPDGKTKLKVLWCAKREKSGLLESKQMANRDTSKEWTVTIQEYTWMPTFDQTKGVTEYFRSIYDDRSPFTSEFEAFKETGGTGYTFRVKDMCLMPVIVFFFGLIGGYLCLAKSKNPLNSLFPLITGIWVVKDYLGLHIFQLGKLWQVHLGIGIAMIAFALIPTAAYILRAIKWFNPNAAE